MPSLPFPISPFLLSLLRPTSFAIYFGVQPVTSRDWLTRPQWKRRNNIFFLSHGSIFEWLFFTMKERSKVEYDKTVENKHSSLPLVISYHGSNRDRLVKRPQRRTRKRNEVSDKMFVVETNNLFLTHRRTLRSLWIFWSTIWKVEDRSKHSQAPQEGVGGTRPAASGDLIFVRVFLWFLVCCHGFRLNRFNSGRI